jgi:hypothetical protein
MSLGLLKCIAKPLVRNIGNLIGFGVGGNIAVEVWENWEKETTAAEREEELRALARDEIKAAVALIVQQEAARLSPAQQQQVEAYLLHTQASVRRSFRRSSDPAGKTVPPGFVLQQADDLLARLSPQPQAGK